MICTRCQILLEGRALFDCQAIAGIWQLMLDLQATNVQDLMQRPGIGRMIWFVHKCLACVDERLDG
jgi:hypothetical protein